MSPAPALAVYYVSEADRSQAEAAASFCGVSAAALGAEPPASPALIYDHGALTVGGDVQGKYLRASLNPFDDPSFRRRMNAASHEALARALGTDLRGTHSFRVLDATGGLGRDASLIAAAASPHVIVEAAERVPAVYLLMQRNVTGARVTPRFGDAAEMIQGEGYDAVYVDPMFEEGHSAAPHKELALLRLLADGASDDSAALACACAAARVPRVVVKRRLNAPPLPGLRVSGSVKGKAVRYDISVMQ